MYLLTLACLLAGSIAIGHRPCMVLHSCLAVCGQFLHFFSSVSHLLSFVFGVYLSGVSRPSSFSLRLGVPFSLLYFVFYWQLFGPLTQRSVG